MSPSLLSKLLFTRSLCYWNQADSWWGFDMGVKLIVVVDVGRRRDGWKQFVGVRFLLMPHTVIFTTKTVATERALKIPVPRVHHLVTLEVFTGWKPLVTLAALKSFLTRMSFGSLLTRNLHLYKMLWLLLFATFFFFIPTFFTLKKYLQCYYHEFDYILRERFRSIFQKFKCTSTLKGATILRNLNWYTHHLLLFSFSKK